MAESLKEDGRPAQQWYWDDWFSEFGLRLCSLAARGLWMDMLGIMFKAEIRGTLTVNGRQINSKALAKICNSSEQNINKYLDELEEQEVFSRLEDKTIINRRMFSESNRKEEISKIRSEAGKRGAEKRWQADGKVNNKKMAKMASSTSSSTPTVSSSSKNKNVIFQIIEYLNEKTGKEFSSKSQASIDFINGRLAEGRTLGDFKRVVDIKVDQWGADPKMSGFLRPSTLFRPTNFENYLNETLIIPTGKSTYTLSKADNKRQVTLEAYRKELLRKYKPDIEKANKAEDLDALEIIENTIKTEVAQRSREI